MVQVLNRGSTSIVLSVKSGDGTLAPGEQRDLDLTSQDSAQVRGAVHAGRIVIGGRALSKAKAEALKGPAPNISA